MPNSIQHLHSNDFMSAVTVFNHVVYLSGQVPSNPEADIDAQTRNVFNTI